MREKLIKDFFSSRKNNEESSNHLYVDITGDIRIGRGISINLAEAKKLPFFLNDKPNQMAMPEQIEREFNVLLKSFHHEFPENFVPAPTLFLKKKDLHKLEVKEISHSINLLSDAIPNFYYLPEKNKLAFLELIHGFKKLEAISTLNNKIDLFQQPPWLTFSQNILRFESLCQFMDLQKHNTSEFTFSSYSKQRSNIPELTISSYPKEIYFSSRESKGTIEINNFLEFSKIINGLYLMTLGELFFQSLNYHYSQSPSFPSHLLGNKALIRANIKRDADIFLSGKGAYVLGRLGYFFDACANLGQKLHELREENLGTKIAGLATEALELVTRWCAEYHLCTTLGNFLAIAGLTETALIVAPVVLTAGISGYSWDATWKFATDLLSQFAPFCYAPQDFDFMQELYEQQLLKSTSHNSLQLMGMQHTPFQQLNRSLFNGRLPLFSSNNSMIPFAHWGQSATPMSVITISSHLPSFNDKNSLTTGADSRALPLRPINIIRDINNLKIGEKLFSKQSIPKEPRGNYAIYTDNHGRINWQVNVNDPLLAAPLIGAMALLGKIKEWRLPEKEKALKNVRDCFTRLARAQSKTIHFDNLSFMKWPELIAQRKHGVNRALNRAVKAYKDEPVIQLEFIATLYALKGDREDLLKNWPLNVKQICFEYIEDYQQLSNEFYRYYQNDTFKSKEVEVARKMVTDFSIFPNSYLTRALSLETYDPNKAKKMADKAVSKARERISAKVLIGEDIKSNIYSLENQRLDLYYRIFQNAGINKDRHAKELYELASTANTCRQSARTYQVAVCVYQNKLPQAIEHQKELCFLQDTLENSFKLSDLYFKNNDKLNTVITLKLWVDKMPQNYSYFDSETKKKVSCTHLELFIAAIHYLQKKDLQDAIEYLVSCKQLNPPQEILSVIKELEEQIQGHEREVEKQIQCHNNAVMRQRILKICELTINSVEIGINLYLAWRYYKLATRVKNMKIYLPAPDTRLLQLHSSSLRFPNQNFNYRLKQQLNNQHSRFTLIKAEQQEALDRDEGSQLNEENQESHVSTCFFNPETLETEHSTGNDLQKAEQKLNQLSFFNRDEGSQLNQNRQQSYASTYFFNSGPLNTNDSFDNDLQNAEQKLNQFGSFNRDDESQLNQSREQSHISTYFFGSRTFNTEQTSSNDLQNAEQKLNQLGVYKFL